MSMSSPFQGQLYSSPHPTKHEQSPFKLEIQDAFYSDHNSNSQLTISSPEIPEEAYLSPPASGFRTTTPSIELQDRADFLSPSLLSTPQLRGRPISPIVGPNASKVNGGFVTYEKARKILRFILFALLISLFAVPQNFVLFLILLATYIYVEYQYRQEQKEKAKQKVHRFVLPDIDINMVK